MSKVQTLPKAQWTRVEFSLPKFKQVQIQILIKFHLQNLDILTKHQLQNLNKTSAPGPLKCFSAPRPEAQKPKTSRTTTFFTQKNSRRSAKPFLATNLKSGCLPLMTLPNNAYSRCLSYNRINTIQKSGCWRPGWKKYTPFKEKLSWSPPGKVHFERFQRFLLMINLWERNGLFQCLSLDQNSTWGLIHFC